MPQEFSDADDLAHIRWLATAFADDRYIKIDGRPLMLIYRVPKLPDPVRTADIWRREAQRLGFPDLYLCWVESWGPPPGGPQAFGLDATVGIHAGLGRADLPPAGGSPRTSDPRLPVGLPGRAAEPRPGVEAVPLGDGGMGQHGPPAPRRHHLRRGHPGALRAVAPTGGRIGVRGAGRGELPLHRGLERMGGGESSRARPALRTGLPRSHPGGHVRPAPRGRGPPRRAATAGTRHGRIVGVGVRLHLSLRPREPGGQRRRAGARPRHRSGCEGRRPRSRDRRGQPPPAPGGDRLSRARDPPRCRGAHARGRHRGHPLRPHRHRGHPDPARRARRRRRPHHPRRPRAPDPAPAAAQPRCRPGR